MRPSAIALGHLLMDDPAPRRHPLDVAGGDGPAVAHAVAVLHRPGKDVGDGLDSAVRVPRETRQIIRGNVVAEVVEQQERVEIGGVAEAEGAAQMDACAFQSRLGFDQTFDWPDGHTLSLPRPSTCGGEHRGGVAQTLMLAASALCGRQSSVDKIVDAARKVRAPQNPG